MIRSVVLISSASSVETEGAPTACVPPGGGREEAGESDPEGTAAGATADPAAAGGGADLTAVAV